MTEQEKQLLLVDLCGRLPYRVRVKLWYQVQNNNPLILDEEGKIESLYVASQILHDIETGKIKDFKPYLRPMSSMTEEEIEEFSYRVFQQPDLNMVKEWKTLIIDGNQLSNAVDFLNERMFDWRKIKRDNKYISMIEAGLALEAPEDMYNIYNITQ